MRGKYPNREANFLSNETMMEALHQIHYVLSLDLQMELEKREVLMSMQNSVCIKKEEVHEVNQPKLFSVPKEEL